MSPIHHRSHRTHACSTLLHSRMPMLSWSIHYRWPLTPVPIKRLANVVVSSRRHSRWAAMCSSRPIPLVASMISSSLSSLPSIVLVWAQCPSSSSLLLQNIRWLTRTFWPNGFPTRNKNMFTSLKVCLDLLKLSLICLLPPEPFTHSAYIRNERLKHFSSISEENFNMDYRTPCIVFTGHPSLRFGDVVHFIELWGSSPNNLILFTGAFPLYFELL